VLVEDLLFDVGERHFLEREPRAIFFTHLHHDHAFFTEESAPPLPAPAFAPQRWKGHPELKAARGTKEFGNLIVTAIPTIHSIDYSSCGYIVEDGVSRMMYTGDLIAVRRPYRDRLPDLDLVITDGAFLRRGGLIRRDEEGRIRGHTGIPDLVKFFSPIARRIVFTHLGSWFFKDVAASAESIRSYSNGAQVDVAHDGMVIEL